MESNPPLGRAARDVVLHAVADHDGPGAVVPLERDRHGEAAPRDPELEPDPILQLQDVGSDIELPLRNFERIADLLLEHRHTGSPFDRTA
jgi:hypothetical protein